MAIPYIVEVRDTGGDLVSVLENASSITYSQAINSAHRLSFMLPSDDDKLAYVTLARELWLRNYDTDTVVRKFRLQKKWDTRDVSRIVTQIEALDYMSQLGKSMVIDYTAGLVLAYVDQTAILGGTVKAIAIDATHIYAGDDTDQKVNRYLLSTLAYVDQTAAYGGIVNTIAINSTHLFVGGATTNKVNRYLLTDMSYVDQTPDFGDTITGLCVDASYLYAVGGAATHTEVRKYDLTDMSYDDATPAFGSAFLCVCESGDNIYAGGYGDYKVRKYKKSDMSLLATADTAFGGAVYSIATDGTSVFAGDISTEKVYKFLCSDMTKVEESSGYGGGIYTLALGGDFVYYAGGTELTIHRAFKSNLAFNDESATYGGTIWAIAVNDTHIFAGGAVTKKVNRYTVGGTISDVITDLLAYTHQTPAITIGTINAAYSNEIPSLRADNQSILEILLGLRTMYGGYMEVDNSRQLNWSLTIGEDKGQQIRYGKNLLGIEREVDYTGLFNKIYAYGYDATAGTRIKLSDVQTNDYVEDAVSQAAWSGTYTTAILNFGITNAGTLLQWANEFLSEHSDPVISYRIDTIDLSAHSGFDFEALQLGSAVTVIDEDLGIDVSATVVSLNHPDLLNPQQMVVELANVTMNIGDTLTQIQSNQQQIESVVAAA